MRVGQDPTIRVADIAAIGKRRQFSGERTRMMAKQIFTGEGACATTLLMFE